MQLPPRPFPPLILDRKKLLDSCPYRFSGLFVLLDHTLKADDNVLVQPQYNFVNHSQEDAGNHRHLPMHPAPSIPTHRPTHRQPDSSAKAKDCSPRFRKFTLVCPAAGRLCVMGSQADQPGFQRVSPIIFYL